VIPVRVAGRAPTASLAAAVEVYVHSDRLSWREVNVIVVAGDAPTGVAHTHGTDVDAGAGDAAVDVVGV